MFINRICAESTPFSQMVMAKPRMPSEGHGPGVATITPGALPLGDWQEMTQMPFSLELPMNTPDWTDVGSGVRECYSVIQQPDIPANRLVYPVPFNTIFPSAVP